MSSTRKKEVFFDACKARSFEKPMESAILYIIFENSRSSRDASPLTFEVLRSILIVTSLSDVLLLTVYSFFLVVTQIRWVNNKVKTGGAHLKSLPCGVTAYAVKGRALLLLSFIVLLYS